MLSRFTSLAAVALTLSGCDSLLFVEAESEEICKTLDEIAIPGVPGHQDVSLDTGADYDLSQELSALPMDSVDADLTLNSLTLTPKTGMNDLSFIDTANVSVVGNDGYKPVVSYERATGSVKVTKMELAASSPPNIFSYLKSGKLGLNASLNGVFPESAWSMDARACFRVRTRVNYASALAGGMGGK